METYKIIFVGMVFVFMIGWLIAQYLGRTVRSEELPHNMQLKSRCIEKGKYEVNGVIFFSDSHPEAIRKYRRGVKEGHYDEP